MNVNLGIWDKLSKLTVFLLLLAAASYVFYRWYLPLIQQNQRYRKELLLQDARIPVEERHRFAAKRSQDGGAPGPRKTQSRKDE
jgi:hypothetical protein